MKSIIVKPINTEFIVVWVKLMIRSGHSINDFKLAPLKKHVTITDPIQLESLKTDFANFRQSNLSMEEYFQCNIITAKRERNENFFIPRNIKLTYHKVTLFDLSQKSYNQRLTLI